MLTGFAASTQLLVNAFSPPGALATINGVALSLSALMRIVGPASITSIFAVGVKKHVLDGALAWLVLFSAAFVIYLISSRLPREEGDSAGKPVVADERTALLTESEG